MIFGELPSSVVDAGALAAVLIALLGAFAALAKTRPVRYLWSHLISGPLSTWQTTQISAAVAPLRAEISEVSTALVDHMVEEISLREQEAAVAAADVAERAFRQEEVDSWRDEMRVQVSGLNGSIVGLHRRLDRTLEAIVAGKPVSLSSVAYSVEEEIPPRSRVGLLDLEGEDDG